MLQWSLPGAHAEAVDWPETTYPTVARIDLPHIPAYPTLLTGLNAPAYPTPPHRPQRRLTLHPSPASTHRPTLRPSPASTHRPTLQRLTLHHHEPAHPILLTHRLTLLLHSHWPTCPTLLLTRPTLAGLPYSVRPPTHPRRHVRPQPTLHPPPPTHTRGRGPSHDQVPPAYPILPARQAANRFPRNSLSF